MDLFFEHNDQYFVLDWKSNFLGDRLPDYDQPSLGAAMNEHNYHLQYLIYALAVCRYLQSRLPAFSYERDFGGVIYVFMRGVRKAAGSGIFFVKPSREKLANLARVLDVQLASID